MRVFQMVLFLIPFHNGNICHHCNQLIWYFGGWYIHCMAVTVPPTTPPPQAPFSPTDVIVNTNGGVGTTPVTMPDITIDSLSPAVDIAFIVDGSGSYYVPAPCFAKTLGNNITAILNEADKIAQNVVTGTKNSRYAMISFGASGSGSGAYKDY